MTVTSSFSILAAVFQMGTAGADSVVAEAQKAVKRLSDTVAARETGFSPLIIGQFEDLTPFQGQHWLHPGRVPRRFADLGWPTFVMYAPVKGEWTAVGLAYSEQIGHQDEPPQYLAGTPAPWHLHQWCFGIPGEGLALADGFADCEQRGGRPTPQQISMVHVWTSVPSPEGPFAHDNPALPYLAVGLESPTSHDLADPERRGAVRALALALAETYGARMPYARRVEVFNQDQSKVASLETHREAISSLVPKLLRADESGDRDEYAEYAAAAIAEWEKLRAVYESMAPSPEMLAQLQREHRHALGMDSHHAAGHH